MAGRVLAVAATVALESGEVVAVDRDLNADLAPDAARWVGLDRLSFAATACVDQAQLLTVLDAAHGLQDHLRRAAATAGTDGTVEQALQRLTAPVEALRDARNRLREAETDLAVARREHTRYLELSAQARSAAAARARLAVQEHGESLAVISTQVTRLNELQERFGDTPPSGLAVLEERANLVNRALAAWAGRTDPAGAAGPVRGGAGGRARRHAGLPRRRDRAGRRSPHRGVGLRDRVRRRRRAPRTAAVTADDRRTVRCCAVSPRAWTRPPVAG